jgi:NTE family protein
LSVDKIEQMAGDIGWNELTNFSKTALVRLILSESLLSSVGMEQYMDKYIGEKLFSDLKIPFACVATDIRTGERVVFKEGPVAIAARASATFPAVFHPVAYRHRSLVDGGVVDNLPTDVASKQPGDIVIAVLPLGEPRTVENITVFQALVRTIEIQKDTLMEEKRKSADFLIEPNVGSVSIIDLGRSKECIEAGTVAARKNILDLKTLIIRRVLAMNRAARLK